MFQDITQGPGGAGYSTHTWEILIMLLVAFLLGLLLGYLLWHRYKTRVTELEDENARQHSRMTDLEKDHASLRYKYDELDKDNRAHLVKVRSLNADNSILAGKLASLEAQLAAEGGSGGIGAGALGVAATARGIANLGGAATTKDDLKKIEGIGPKIEGLLNGGGIHTFKQLEKTEVARLKEILSAAGSRYAMHDPGTWPQQAEYAASGQWEKLKEYQDFLQGGKNPT